MAKDRKLLNYSFKNCYGSKTDRMTKFNYNTAYRAPQKDHNQNITVLHSLPLYQ